MTNFDMPNNVSSMKYALKSVPGLADVGVPHGDGVSPPEAFRGQNLEKPAYPVVQWEKLQG